MNDTEKIKLLEKQVELLEQIVELQKVGTPEVIPYPPVAPVYPWYEPITGDDPLSNMTCEISWNGVG